MRDLSNILNIYSNRCEKRTTHVLHNIKQINFVYLCENNRYILEKILLLTYKLRGCFIAIPFIGEFKYGY